jgi:hypothetical protein
MVEWYRQGNVLTKEIMNLAFEIYLFQFQSDI